MKILVLNYEFPPVGGGGGKVAESVCRGLAKRGHEVRVQTAQIRGLPAQEIRSGFTIFRSFSFRQKPESCSVPEMAAYVVFNLIPTLRHLLRWKPDIIHAHFAVPTGVLAYLVSLLTGVPYVLTVHLGDIPGGNPDLTDHLFRIIKPLTMPIWKRAAVVTAISEYSRSVAQRSYTIPIRVIPNGIDLSEVVPSPAKVHHPPHLLFVGRFDLVKNLPFFVDVLGRLKDCEWQMTFLGDGPMMKEIWDRIHSAGIEKQCNLPGWVNQDSVYATMRKADVFVLPSRYEGLSVASLQALAHGLAVIGSDVEGIASIVQNDINGQLCPVGDSDAFEAALREMLSDSEMLSQMKCNSRDMAQAYDMDKVILDYESTLKEACR